jgi:hypothetical protein
MTNITLRNQVMEAINTHPKETFGVKDIIEQLPMVRVTVIYSYIRNFAKKGYVTTLKPGHGKKPAIYQLVKEIPPSRYKKYKKRKPANYSTNH